MATLKIYKTQIVPERNFLVQDIDKYLGSLTPTYTDSNFQFVKPYLDTSIKIEVSLDTWGTADIGNTSLTPMLGNYLSITETIDGANKTFYYYIIGAAFVADGTVSLQISLDTVNTFSDYLYNTSNYTNQTNISRETRARWKWNTTLDFKPVIDKYSENLDLSPSSYYRSESKQIQDVATELRDLDWYLVYMTNEDVKASGQNSSTNTVNTYLVPSDNFTAVNYAYTGLYDGIEAGYDGGYEPYTAPTAGAQYGDQFEVLDYTQAGAPQTYTEIKSRWRTNGEVVVINTYGVATLAGFTTMEPFGTVPIVHNWVKSSLTDNLNRTWNLYKVYMSGQSPEGSSSNYELYITGIYYNSGLDKYIGLRGVGSSVSSSLDPDIYGFNGTSYVNIGRKLNLSNSAYLFDDPNEISLSASGNGCRDVYQGKIWVYMSKNIKSIKSYNSNTQKYSDIFFRNTPSGTDPTTVNRVVTGYQSINRSDSKLIKIIRCPYCPVPYTRQDLPNNGYMFTFKGFSIVAESGANRLKKNVEPTEIFVDLTSNTSDLTANIGWRDPELPIETNNYLYTCEPKLKYGQDTLIRKYAFDNQILNMPYEKYDFNSEGLASVKDDITYMHTREIASDLLFTIKPDDISDNAESYTNYDYGDILLSSRNLEEPILNNDYLNYMRYGYNYEKATMEQNIQAQQISTGISTGVGIVGGTAAGALAGAKMGAAAGGYGAAIGAVVGGVIGLASSILSSTSKIISTNASIDSARRSFNQKIDTLKNQSTAVRSNNAVDLLGAYSDIKLTYLEYRPVDELRLPIANLYHYCGYSHPVQEAPKWCRYWFDFIQCSPVFKENIFKNIYGNYQADIIYRFENGVTVLHNRGYGNNPVYDFEQGKQNWETQVFFDPVLNSISVDGIKYLYNNSSRTVNGVRYYRWISDNNPEVYTRSTAPAVGDTVYRYRSYPSATMYSVGKIDRLNYESPTSITLENPTAAVSGRTLTLSASTHNPGITNRFRYVLYVKDTDGDVFPYPGPGHQITPTYQSYFQMDTDGVDFDHTVQVGVQLVDTANLFNSSAINWQNIQ